MTLAILMYHRVCERTTQTGPYFARGTAVEPDVFEAQMAHLTSHYEVISLTQMVEQLDTPNISTDKPQIVLTFDDGYVDCVKHVLPICSRYGLPFGVFPIAMTGRLECPWVDAYYHILSTSTCIHPFTAGELSPLFDAPAPAPHDNMRWWVRGPVKQSLFAHASSTRWTSLVHLSQRLDVEVNANTISRKLFCQPEDYHTLSAGDVTLGGHGDHHERLGTCTPEFVHAELQTTVNWLDELGCPDDHRIFCYPDGHHSTQVMKAVKAHGFIAALGVSPGIVEHTMSRFNLPRFIVRNLRPTDSKWCAIESYLNS